MSAQKLPQAHKTQPIKLGLNLFNCQCPFIMLVHMVNNNNKSLNYCRGEENGGAQKTPRTTGKREVQDGDYVVSNLHGLMRQS